MGIFAASAAWGRILPEPVGLAASGGFGLPQIPTSRYRGALSILGNGSVRIRLHPRWMLKTEASALTSFSLGTTHDGQGRFQYDTQSATVSPMWAWKRSDRTPSYFYGGWGRYHFIQQIDAQRVDISTSGIRLGAEFHRTHRWCTTFTDLSWHMLFEPSENPQILTVSFGIIL
jgi:hypothetical protein